MNKKGFTLIEALLVLAIIGILLLTLIPSVITIINKNKEKTCISTKESILSATKMYLAENKYDFDIACDEEWEMFVSELQEFGKIADNKKFDEKFLETPITIIYDCDKRTFIYQYDVSCES